MYIAEYLDNWAGRVKIAVATPKELLSVACLLNNQEIPFHVYDCGVCANPRDFGWGELEFWKAAGQPIHKEN